MKHYKDLSRRALIKLGKDFDDENNDMLIDFLNDNSESYEDVRPIERVIEKADHVKESAIASKSCIKGVITREMDKLLDTIVDTLSNGIAMAETEIEKQ